jgi:hypothetical protein
LVVKPGAGHGWPTILQDIAAFGDWFDDHLKKPGVKSQAEAPGRP